MDGFIGAGAFAQAAFYGRADLVESAMVTGWFVAPETGRTAGQVTALVDGEPAGQAKIQPILDRPDDVPKAARRFAYPIPLNVQDGRSHLLSLVLEDGSPIEFPTRHGVTRCNLRFRFEQPIAGAGQGVDLETQAKADAANSAYAGLADPFSGTTITGWAVCRTAPDQPVHLRAFIDGHAAGAVLCDRPHEGLRALGLPDHSGGFAYQIRDRFLDGMMHTLSFLFEDGTSLFFKDETGTTRSKLNFTAEPVTSIEGVVDGLHGDLIKGWVVRKQHTTGDYEGFVPLQVLCNGIVIGEIVADQPRMDVAREHRCDPHVGFTFKLPAHCRNGTEFEFVFRTVPEGEVLAGCPLPVKHRVAENVDELLALTATVNELATKAFKLQRQVRALMPVPEATVSNYDAWARRYLSSLRARTAALPPLAKNGPLISVIMPTYKTNLAYLTAAIGSVREQTYGNWELVIADDGSGERGLEACLRDYAEKDRRITCLFGKKNRGISAATNMAVRKARGDYVVLFDHDDLMVEVALEVLLREALRTGAEFLYSDEDKIDTFGVLSEPNLKPDWNYRLLLGVNYICHLVMIEHKLLRAAGLFRSEYDGAQDHDLLLRVAERCKADRIAHVPEILYHWRKSASSTAELGEAKPYAIEAGCRAVEDHLKRQGFKACCVTPTGKATNYSVSWGIEDQPSVTIIVPFKDQIPTTRRCLESLLANTTWRKWRVILIDNGSVTPEAEAFCREAVRNPNVVVRRIDEPFNYSRLNNIAAQENPADYYLFLNNDVFLEQKDWLRVMMSEALANPEVGIVGAKLLYPNGTVQHAGVVLGVGGIADHVFRGIPADHPGYLARARCAQRYSAVTAACLLCRADAFMDVGGFDEQELVVAFNDVDLCLKVGKRGWHIIWTPELVAEHHKSLSRGDDVSPTKAPRFFYENHVMLDRWHDVLANDPFYNPHFSRDRGLFTDLK